jgi:hypothetical protein
MAPMFVSVALGNAMEATTSEKRDATWHATTQLNVRGHAPMLLHDFGVSVGGTPDSGTFMGSRAVRTLGALLNNPWQPVTIEGVETKLEIRYARDLWTLRGTDPLQTEIDAGQKARLRLHLVPYSGPEELRVVEVDIPRELAGESVEIEIVPGHQASPELARPENLADLMVNLPRQSYPPDVFVASVHVGGQGLAHRGQVASRLPPGALDTLRSTSSTMAPEPFPSVVRTVLPMHHFVVGRDAVKVRVRENLR